MAERKWILIVDDEEDVILSLRDYIKTQRQQYAIIVARDGKDAFQKITNQKFDCIVTDLKMPKVDGATFITWARSSEKNKHCPIIVVSSSPDQKLADLHDHIWLLEKPVNLENFLAIVDRQIVLGSTNKRLPAELMNRVMNITKDVLTEFSLEISDLLPSTRLKSDLLKGQNLLALRLQYEGAFFWFLIGSDDVRYVEQKVDVFIESAFRAHAKKHRISVDMCIAIEREKVNLRSLMGLPGLRIEYKTQNGSYYLEAIVGREFTLDPVNSRL